jgi:magnesium chelatase family protein
MAALSNSGFETPLRRITVNLAPADEPKSGTGFDLPIALAILKASRTIATPTGWTGATGARRVADRRGSQGDGSA